MASLVMGIVGMALFAIVRYQPQHTTVLYSLLCGVSVIAACVVPGIAFRAFPVTCHTCGQNIQSQIAWICGDCGRDNTDTLHNSFLEECKHCDNTPPGMLCPKCGGGIFPGTESSRTRWAAVADNDSNRLEFGSEHLKKSSTKPAASGVTVTKRLSELRYMHDDQRHSYFLATFSFIFMSIILVVGVPYKLMMSNPWTSEIRVSILVMVIWLAVGVYKYLILGRERWISCASCNGSIGSFTPWVCGRCKNVNKKLGVLGYPFYYKCKFCKSAPAGFQCPYCKEAVFNYTEHSRSRWGYKDGEILVQKAPDPENDPKEMERDRKRDDLRWEIEVAQLNAKLQRQLADFHRAESERYEANAWRRKPEPEPDRLKTKQQNVKRAIQEIEVIESTIQRSLEQLARKWREKENDSEDEIIRRQARIKTAGIQAAKESVNRK